VRQRTLKESISASGIGLHTGEKVYLTLRPAPANTGIVFRRLDLPQPVDVPADALGVTETTLGTTLERDSAKVGTVEHLMSAMAGLGVDNAFVDLTGPEVPIMDGSAAPFVFLLQSAGIEEQGAQKRFIRVRERVEVKDGDRWVRLDPYDGFRVNVEIVFDHPALRKFRQSMSLDFSTQAFLKEISRARTFGFLKDIAALEDMGLAGGGRLNNFILESHIEPLVERAPPQPPVTGGVFSVDLVGDEAPETVALYRSTGGAPAALLLESRAGEFRARTTDPLLEPADVGLERWEEGTSALGLYAPLRVDGLPLLLIELPSSVPAVTTVAAYRVAGDGALQPALVATPEGAVAAVFQDGQVGDESRQLGVVDLDGDRSPEIVVAVGIRVEAVGAPSVRWRATVLGWTRGGLVSRPELEALALDRIARVTGAAVDSPAGADTATGVP